MAGELIMKCDEVQQLHGPYLDSELDAKTTSEIQQHVATCGECVRLFATEAKLDARLMAGLRQGQRTAALWEQVEQRVVTAAQSDARSRPSTLDARPPGWLSTINSQLSTLLWPHPKAWAGLAAVWLVILGVNFATGETTPRLEARVTPPSPDTLRLLKQQEQLLAELSGWAEPREADRPKATPPRPRTERRDEQLNA
jgi:anti-sigma factor RsiW